MSDPHSNHKDRGVVRYIGKVCITERDVRHMDNLEKTLSAIN